MGFMRCRDHCPGGIESYYYVCPSKLLLRGGLRKSGACHFVSLLHLFFYEILLTSIRVHDLLIVEETTITRKHQNSSAHIAIMATTTRRITNLGRKLRLVALIRLAGSHLRRENSRRNSVDANFAVFESRGQHAAQVGACCFRRSVCELAVAGTLHGAADGADVDDLRCVARSDFSAFGEQGEHGHCHEVLPGHVGLECLSPLGVF
jgi:hypothetical protein